MFSDSYKMEVVKDLYYRVTGKLISESNEIDDSKIGGNASAEGAEEGGVDSSSTTGVDIVIACKLQEVLGMDKKGYMTLYKGYCKTLVEHYQKEKPDEVGKLKERLVAFRGEVKGMWNQADDFQVYQGENSDSEGMFALLGYNESDTPFMVFFRDGLLEEKF